MALKPTIFKFTISMSDLDNDYYESLAMTVAQHPSETTERMMVRVLAFCLNACEGLAFTAGLSTPDEPDILARSLDDRLLLWVDVGEPGFERIKKATRMASTVKVFCFNSKSTVWWQKEQPKFKALEVAVTQFSWPDIQSLAALVQRSMDFSLTISGGALYIAAPLGEAEVSCKVLQ